MSVLDDERHLLERWAGAFAVVNGWAPILEDFLDGTFTCTFEPRFEPIEMLAGTTHFIHRPKLVEHLSSMGFRWSDVGRVLTVPSPESFNRLADRLLPPGVGYRVGTIVRDQRNLALGPWLRMYLAGRIPVHLSTEAFYDAILAAGERPWDWRDRRFQFQSFAHDLTVHALNYQFVPRAAIDAFAARIVAALPERVTAWGARDAPGPLTLTTFFDNDLNRFCYAVWWRCEDPADFVEIFLEHLPQLVACLDQRIAETRDGLGDAPDEDTRHLAPLATWDFEVKARVPPPPPDAPPSDTSAPPSPTDRLPYRDDNPHRPGPLAGPQAEPPGRWVVPAGQEALVRRLLALEGDLCDPERWRFLGASVGDAVVGRYRRGAALAEVTLRHPEHRTPGAVLTARFALSVRSSADVVSTAALVSAVLATVRACEEPFQWVDAAVRPKAT